MLVRYVFCFMSFKMYLFSKCMLLRIPKEDMALSQKYCVQPEKLHVYSQNICSLAKLLHSPGKHNTWNIVFPLTSYYFHHKSFTSLLGKQVFCIFSSYLVLPILESYCPADFSSNPNQTHLNHLIKEFRATWQLQAGVLEQGWKWSLQDGSSPGAELEFPVFQLHML